MNAPALKSPRLAVAGSLREIDPAQWNALVSADNPFLEHEFLSTLEEARCVGEGTGWLPQYLTLEEGGRLIGAAAAYVRFDSYGEYIFDWEWARAYERSRIPYYPKLTVAVPFTPATGDRLLVHPDCGLERCGPPLLEGLLQLAEANRLSSVHALFTTQAEHDLMTRRDFLSRVTYQFHWDNRGYKTFDDFLADLRHAKRKQIRKERREVAAQGIEIEVVEGSALRREHLDALWLFYEDTHSRKWGQGYLNRRFFQLALERLSHRIVAVLAKQEGRYVGGTFNLRKGDHLFGRYWGARGHYPSLHFECCYHRLIEYAIDNGIQHFEAGAQGEHKFLRGFAARPTYSAHWIAHSGGRSAIAAFLEQERVATKRIIAAYNAQSPLKYVRRKEG